MATNIYDIVVQSSGYKKVRRDIGGIGDSAKASARSVNLLSKALKGLGVTFAFAEFVKLADSAIRLENQLRNLTDTEGNLRRVTNELFETARKSRSAIEPTVELYARLARSTENLGLAQKEVLDLTDLTSKAFKIYGNTAAEAEAAVIQFGQGLSIGVLRGDELRSVLEQAPRLAKAIKDGLNEIGDKDLAKAFGRGFKQKDGTFDFKIVQASLRELGKEGELTTERIIEALKTQKKVIDEEFGRTLPTIEDGVTAIENKLTQLAGSPLVKAFATGLANSLFFVADNMENLIKIATIASVFLGTRFVVQGVLPAIRSLTALSVSLLETGYIYSLYGTDKLKVFILLMGESTRAVFRYAASLLSPLGTLRTLSTASVGFGKNALIAFSNAAKGVGLFALNLATGNFAAAFAQLGSAVSSFGKIAGAAFRGLSVVIFSTPVGFLLVGLATLVAAVYLFGDSLSGLSDKGDTLKDDLVAVFYTIYDVAEPIITGIFELWNSTVTGIYNLFGFVGDNWKEVLTDMLKKAYDLIRNLTGAFYGMKNALVAIFNGFSKAVKNSFIDLFNGLGNAFSSLFNKTVMAINKIRLFLNKNASTFQTINFKNLKKDGKTAGELISKAFSEGQKIGFADFDKFASGVKQKFDKNLTDIVKERKKREAEETLRGPQAADGPSILKDDKKKKKKKTKKDREAEEFLEELKKLADLTKIGTALTAENSKATLINNTLKREAFLVQLKYANASEIATKRLLDSIGLQKDSRLVVQAQIEILEDVQGTLNEYAIKMTALNILLKKGTISQGQFNEAVAGLKINTAIDEIDKSLTGTIFAEQAAIKEIELAKQASLNRIQEAVAAGTLSEQEAADRIVAINLKAFRDIADARTEALSNRPEIEQFNKQFDDARDAISSITANLGGNQDVFATAAEGIGSIAEKMAEIQQSNAINTLFSEEQLQIIEDSRQAQLESLQKALDENLITQQKYADESVKINAEADKRIADQKRDSLAAQLEMGRQTAEGLLSATEALAGKQSGVYKAMFVATKAFAIADSIIKIQQGVASALALPFPANIPAIASVVAQGAALISNIQAVTAQFKDGGYVSGAGTSTSDSIYARLSNGEFVVNAKQTDKYRPYLEAMNAGKDPYVYTPPVMVPTKSNDSSGAAINITVENYTSADISVQQISEKDVRIIARQEASKAVREQSPKIIAGEINNPNSHVSKSLSNNTQAGRRY